MKPLVILAVLLLSPALPAAPAIDPVRHPDAVLTQEVADMKWGMFVCWSFSTFSGKEWTPGVKDVSFFKATGCDTDQWAQTAKKAGMGYILFLTKHHDGFCLWDTQTTDRKVTKSTLGRDVMAELRQSCDKYGIRLAIYFSEGEWLWPDKPGGGRYRNNGGHNPEMKKAQLKELLTQYGPIKYIWFDHAVGDGGLGHAETVKWCQQLQPNCLVGFNNGEKAGNIQLGEMGRPGPIGQKTGIGHDSGDSDYRGYLVAEFTYPILPKHQGGAQWFYSLPKHDSLCLPAEKLYQDYLGAVKYSNLFSADVGPDYAGKLREIDVKTLQKVGQYIRGELKLPRLWPAKAAAASGSWDAGHTAGMAVDNDIDSRWGAEQNARSGWLEIDLGEARTASRILVDEAGFDRIRKFEIQIRAGEAWQTVARGSTLGSNKEIRLKPPVTAQFFRLNILESSEVPTISEFQLVE
jgi:alpha-L-fucosidase